jgi:hypothetical protein
MKVYPSLRREPRQKIEASFKTCRAYDVTFSEEQVLIDPTNASVAQVTLHGTYTCTVRTGQPPQVAESRDVFMPGRPATSGLSSVPALSTDATVWLAPDRNTSFKRLSVQSR